MSSLSKGSVETNLQVTHVYNKCYGLSTTEESYSILTVSIMALTVREANNKNIADESPFEDNKAFCGECGCKRVKTIEIRISHALGTLIFQMQHCFYHQLRDLSVLNVF